MHNPFPTPRQLDRYPVTQVPSVPFTAAALPTAAEVRAHSMRYLTDQTVDEALLWQQAVAQHWPALVLLLLAPLGVHGLAFVPGWVVVAGAMLLGVGSAVLHLLWAYERSLRVFMQRLVLWPLGLLGGHWLATHVLLYRVPASLALLGLSLVLLFAVWWPGHPLRFWADYLFCAPWLTPATQQQQWDIIRGEGRERWPWYLLWGRNVLYGGALLYLVLGWGSTSIRGAALGLFALGLLFSDGCRPQVLRALRRLLAHYLTYPDLPLPGVYLPAASLVWRRRYLALTLLCCQFGLSTGLTLYFPSDWYVAPPPSVSAVRPSATPSPTPAGKRGRRRARPTPTPTRSPAPAPVVAPPSPTADTYAGLRQFFARQWAQPTLTLAAGWDALGFPLLCALTLPLLLWLAAWRGFLLEAERLAAWLATVDDREQRTEWEWYVDRLQPSWDGMEEDNEENDEADETELTEEAEANGD